MYPSPAHIDESIHIFWARGLSYGETHLDEGEFLECERIPLDKMVKMALSGEIPDAKTQLAVLKVNELIKDQ